MSLTFPRKVAAGALAVLASASLVACTSAAGSDDPEKTITVGTLRAQPHLYHPYFYEDFAPEGYDVEVVVFDSSPDIKNAVVSGEVDFGITGLPSALSGVVADEDVVVVASAADGGSGFVGVESITAVADLADATVGYPQGASQEILLRLTLENHGLTIDDLDLVNLPFSDMAAALDSGQIDAFLSAEMGPSIAIQGGAHVIDSPYETPVGRVNIALVTRAALIEEDSDYVATVVGIHQQTVEYMLANPDAWVDGLVDTFGLDRDVVEIAITNIWLRHDLSDEYLSQVAALSEQMAGLTHIPFAPDNEDVFDSSFAEK